MNRLFHIGLALFVGMLPLSVKGEEKETIITLPSITVVETEEQLMDEGSSVRLPSFTLVSGPDFQMARVNELPLHIGPPTRDAPEGISSGPILKPGARILPTFTSFPALLTFDDGPNPLVTPRLISYLKKAGLTDTIFFFVGDRMAKYPGLVRRVARAGFPIGYHSMSHQRMEYLPEWAIRKDIRRFKKVLNKILGYDYPLVWGRPPYGGLIKQGEEALAHRPFSRRLINRVAANIHSAFTAEGMGMMLWDVDTEDWKRPLKARLVSNQFTPGRRQIWLFHEYVKTDIVRKLPDLLWRFQEMIVRRTRPATTG